MSTDKPSQVVVSESDLSSVIDLVQNSVKHRSKRPPVIVVDAGLESGTISVTDNGRGIPQEQWARVFERSNQVRTTDDGLGLGLARCRTILALLGGGIAIRASGEWGTRFELHLGPGALTAVSSHV